MRTFLACLSAAAVAVLAAGCSSPSLEDTVQDFLDSRSLTVTDCGTANLDETCTDQAAPEVQCFIDALATCEPTRLTLVQSTIEGDPITTVYVLLPEDPECGVEIFIDTTQDQFGEKRITEKQCPGMSGAGTCDDPMTAVGCDDA